MAMSVYLTSLHTTSAGKSNQRWANHIPLQGNESTRKRSPTFSVPEPVPWGENTSMDSEGWLQDDSAASHLLGTFSNTVTSAPLIDHQALGPRGWGPQFRYKTKLN